MSLNENFEFLMEYTHRQNSAAIHDKHSGSRQSQWGTLQTAEKHLNLEQSGRFYTK